MHGIQHLYRQHALEKQISADGWHSAQSHISNQAHLYHNYPNMRVNSTTSSSGADSPSGSMAKSPNWSQGRFIDLWGNTRFLTSCESFQIRFLNSWLHRVLNQFQSYQKVDISEEIRQPTFSHGLLKVTAGVGASADLLPLCDAMWVQRSGATV